jgi:NAD+ kinase
MTMPENLVIVRHGESIGNLAKRRSERGDHTLLERLHGTHTSSWPLTKKGIEQARKTGIFLNKLSNDRNMFFDKMYVSSYARAIQTAANLDLIRAEWSVDTRITERDWGELDRLTEEERQEKFGEALKIRTVAPYFWVPPNGESFKKLNIYVRDIIDSLHRVEVPNVLLSCHGEVMKAFRIVFFQMTPMEYAEMEFSTDPLKRIHNCQVDHYTRRDPVTLKISSHRLEHLTVYRPSEQGDVVVSKHTLPRKRYSSHELQQMANKLSRDFADLDL